MDRSGLRVWRIRNYDEIGEPEEVALDRAIKKRLVYLNARFKGDLLVYAFLDKSTGEVYIQEAPEQPD